MVGENYQGLEKPNSFFFFKKRKKGHVLRSGDAAGFLRERWLR
jgi:hypothetical protein